MSRAGDLPEFLRQELSEAKHRNPAFSMRAFAKKTGLGVGTLSMLLAGKRQLSTKSTLKVLDRLAVSPKMRARLMPELVTDARSRLKPSFRHTQLSADQYQVLSEWYYFAILSLIRTKDFVPSAKHISARLGIGIGIAQKALARLERLDLIHRDGKRLMRTHVAIETTDEVQSAAVRCSHYQTLDRARVALDQVPIELRDFTWLTFAFQPNKLAEFKKRVREFQDEITEEFSFDPEPTEVYRLGIQFFPLTQISKKQPRSPKI